jgi:membrane protein
LSLGASFQAYGVIGGVLLLSLWVWLVALVLYFGIALTVVLTPARYRSDDDGDGLQAV